MTDEKILYLLMTIEASLRVQTELLIEIADIVTQKDPGVVSKEVIAKKIIELKKVREDINLIHDL